MVTCKIKHFCKRFANVLFYIIIIIVVVVVVVIIILTPASRKPAN